MLAVETPQHLGIAEHDQLHVKRNGLEIRHLVADGTNRVRGRIETDFFGLQSTAQCLCRDCAVEQRIAVDQEIAAVRTMQRTRLDPYHRRLAVRRRAEFNAPEQIGVGRIGLLHDGGAASRRSRRHGVHRIAGKARMRSGATCQLACLRPVGGDEQPRIADEIAPRGFQIAFDAGHLGKLGLDVVERGAHVPTGHLLVQR